MAERPKRRKHKDNPYVLENIKNNEYKITFVDGKGIKNTIKVNQEIYYVFDSFELEDKSLLNEYERHIEHSEVYEENLHNRSVDKPMELEDFIIQKTTFEELHKAIKQLPVIQQRRIKMYYFSEMTFEEIAQLENCTKRAVKFTIDIALRNLKEILKK